MPVRVGSLEPGRQIRVNPARVGMALLCAYLLASTLHNNPPSTTHKIHTHNHPRSTRSSEFSSQFLSRADRPAFNSPAPAHSPQTTFFPHPTSRNNTYSFLSHCSATTPEIFQAQSAFLCRYEEPPPSGSQHISHPASPAASLLQLWWRPPHLGDSEILRIQPQPQPH